MNTKMVFAVLFFSLLLMNFAFALSDDEKAQNVAKKAAATLGWPETFYEDKDNSAGIPGKGYIISEDEKGSNSDHYGYITTLSTDVEGSFWLNFMVEQLDAQHSSFLGREASIVTGGKNCNPQGLVKVMNDMFSGWFEDIFGPSNDEDKGCVYESGVIAFTCGKYMMVGIDTWDDESTGDETEIASAFYSAAQEEGLCDYGDTLVIMAQPNDKSGNLEVSDAAAMAQRVNQYYGVNAFGEIPPFKYTFMDADGSKGHDDWFTLDSPENAYVDAHGEGDELKFSVDATKTAFKGADVPEDLYFNRVVILFPGDSTQKDPNAKFSNQCSWEGDNYFVEVDAGAGKRKIYTKSFITLSENRELGGWAHEFGHSLYSRYVRPVNKNTISDRYNYASNDRQYGQVDYWDIMGSGSHWGPNDGEAPTQMSSFTKVAATWLEFYRGNVNQTYSVKALESMKKGDNVLTIDDPTSADPEAFYIIEARDSTLPFGAPESGVVLYKVRYEFSHHVVNIIAPQTVPNKATNTAGQDYTKPTLYNAVGPGSTYIDVPGKFEVKLMSQSDSPYSASVEVDPFNPMNMLGMMVAPGAPPINFQGDPSSTENALPDTMPDQDLHAYDDAGNHVGLNYDTMEYENNIPGAIASGDLKGDAEWIFVPAGTNVRYEVSEYKTKKFLESYPQYASLAQPQNYSVEMVKYDASGNKYVADGGSGNVGTSSDVQLKSPTDPSLKYEQKENPGFGSNSICPLLPAFVLLLGFAFLSRRN